MLQVPATGVTIPQTGSGGWIDGFRDLLFTGANQYIAREFPEQTESSNTDTVVRDDAVSERDASKDGFTRNQLLLMAGGGLATLLLVITLTRR